MNLRPRSLELSFVVVVNYMGCAPQAGEMDDIMSALRHIYDVGGGWIAYGVVMNASFCGSFFCRSEVQLCI